MTYLNIIQKFITTEKQKKFLLYLSKYENLFYKSPILFYISGLRKKLIYIFIFEILLITSSIYLEISYTLTVALCVLVPLGYLYSHYLSKLYFYLNRKLLYSFYSIVLFDDFLFLLTLNRNLFTAIANIVQMQINPISKAFSIILKKAILLNSIEDELVEFARYVPSENFRNTLFSILSLMKTPLDIENLEYYLEFRKENLLFYTKITLSYGFFFFLLIFLTLVISLINPFNLIICIMYFAIIVVLQSVMEKLVVFKNEALR